MTPRPEADKFLRAAVKTGLRLQQQAGGGAQNAGVRALERIKTSLRKRNSNRKANV